MENVEFSRTKLHENAFICIFQYLFYAQAKNASIKKSLEEIISDVMGIKFEDCDDFFKALVYEPIKDKQEIIGIIQENLKKSWKFNRLCLTDQAILLLFASEILNHRVEIQVATNEAVELAKKYCDENSYKYINAVLDNIGKQYA